MTSPDVGVARAAPGTVWTVAGHDRVLRFVVGSEHLPELPFAAPDAPGWMQSSTVTLRRHGIRFVLADGGGRILSGQASQQPFRVSIEVGDADVLGFGAATGRPTRNDSRFTLLTRDTLLYGIPGASYTAMPFFIARDGPRAVGVLLATTYPLDVEVSNGRVGIAGACDVEGSPLDLIVLRGSVADIVRDLATLVGRSFLPPTWALGFHQSRWSYGTERCVLGVARRFRALELPADVIHLDIDYMDRYRVFTFSPQRFPRPRSMHDELRALGFRTMAIIDPGVSVAPYPVYETLKAGDMLLTRRDGSAFEGRVWPGATVFPDFTQAHVRETWGRFHASLVSAGVAGFWNDMNDPVLRMGESRDPLTEDAWHHGVPHRRVRNLYANGMAEATVEGLRSLRPGSRPFVLSRSGFLGIQRSAAIWTGDNHSSWRHLRENLDMVINLGLSGVALAGADVGGFGRGPGKYGLLKPLRPSVELFVRWMELGSLMPFFRVHTTRFSPRQEPWSFGQRALDLARRVLRRRYRWLPLLYRLALESSESGLPIVRPLFMHFDVPRGRGTDQFLLGDSVMVAPVLHKGAVQRNAWLPPGPWVQWHTGETHAGGREVTVAAPLGATPIFVRAGSALFLAEPGRNAEETLSGPLALEITVPAPGAAGRGSLFLDDGMSATGVRFVLDVRLEQAASHLRLDLAVSHDDFLPPQRDLELRVPATFASATVDGEQRDLAPFEDHEDRYVRMRVCRVPLRTRAVVLE